MKPKTLKPIPFYFITTTDEAELTYEKALESMTSLKERGMGGAVLFNKPPTGFNAEEYLSEKWFWAIGNFIKAAEALDLEIWINDGFDYPPGAAAGKVRQADPTLHQYRIKRVNGKPEAQIVDWGFPAFENPKSSKLFLEIVYEQYKKRFGQYFGNVIRGFFSDADNRRVNAGVFMDKNSPQKDYFPWSEDFRNTFKAAYGYDIWDHIDDVLDRKDSQHSVNYWEHCATLYTQWFQGNYSWCKANGLEYTFHTSDTSPFSFAEMPRSSSFTEGKFCDVEKNGDYCGTDQELLEVNGGKHYTAGLLYIPEVSYGTTDGCRKSPEYYDVWGDTRTKQAQSTAFIYDKKGAMCEMFAASNYGVSYEELRQIAAFQIMQGITFIVPHAFQYRVLGETKYFAPPDFSPKGHVKYAKEFFGDLEKYMTWSSQGKLIAPIAVLDVTEDLWRHRGDQHVFMDVCQKLNRMPYGYVIADKAGIERKKDAFSLIINTGVDTYESLSGIPVVNIRSADELEAAVASLSTPLTYEGTGMPHFMIRDTEGGLCALVANIETAEEITGTVTFQGKQYPIALLCGEIAYFSADKQVYRSPAQAAASTLLPAECPVTWEKENLIPITAWLDENGNTVVQHEDTEVLSFRYFVESDITGLKLHIPCSCAENITELSGVDLDSCKEEKVFDDPYYCYDISPVSGWNTITLKKNAALHYSNVFFLSGEFDVAVASENPFYKKNYCNYNLLTFVPEKLTVRLSTRRTILDTTKSAALQGHPFYFGGVTYHAEVDVPADYENYSLRLVDAGNGATVKLGSSDPVNLLYRPYTVPCSAAGKQALEITSYATLANFLEMYPREFGIIGGILLEKN